MAMSAETKARRAEARKFDKRMSRLIPIAEMVKVQDATQKLVFINIDGVGIKGTLDHVNGVLERLGYRPVRITSNMLGRENHFFCIDINTPSYLDPGSEAYHSM